MHKIYNQHKISSTKKWENIKNKTGNNDHNIQERTFLLFASISTSHSQPSKITSQEQKVFKMFLDEFCVMNMKKVLAKSRVIWT